jgi:hypothetical protein
LIYVAHGTAPALGLKKHHDLANLGYRVLAVDMVFRLESLHALFELGRRHVTDDRFGQAALAQTVPGGHVQMLGAVGGISQNAMPTFRPVINPSRNPSRQASSSVLRFFLLIFPQALRN